MANWTVMAGVDVEANKGFQTSFDSNATNLTKDEAEAESERRNAVERANGNLGVMWYPVEEIPLSAELRKMLNDG